MGMHVVQFHDFKAMYDSMISIFQYLDRHIEITISIFQYLDRNIEIAIYFKYFMALEFTAFHILTTLTIFEALKGEGMG